MAALKATRRSAVLTLQQEVILLSTLGGFKRGDHQDVTATVPRVKIITARRPSGQAEASADPPSYEIWFWVAEKAQDPKFKIEMFVPSCWSARILLGAIHWSIMKQQRIVIYEEWLVSLLRGMNKPFISINNIATSMFPLSKEQILETLHNHHCFATIEGGQLES